MSTEPEVNGKRPESQDQAFVRCYAELNDYLPERCRQRDFSVSISDTSNVRRLVADLGIPPAEVELVLVNGMSGGLDCDLRAGNRVSLYPMFESFDVAPLLQLRPKPLRRVRFVADAHLGRLARYLRLLGFDTLFENDPGDAELARISAEEGRILLSRDRRLLERRILTHALRIPAVSPREQLLFVVERLNLRSLFRPFTRCTVCNGRLSEVDKDAAYLPLAPRTRAVFETFWRCGSCGRVYWQGSHYDRLRALVEQVTEARNEPGGA